MMFDDDVPKSHVPDYLELLVNALSTTSHSESAKQTCKSHTACLENVLYLLLSDTLFGY